jgi:hypothetical protein
VEEDELLSEEEELSSTSFCSKVSLQEAAARTAVPSESIIHFEGTIIIFWEKEFIPVIKPPNAHLFFV